MTTTLDAKLADHEQRRYLIEHYSQFLFAAGYTSADFDTMPAEDVHHLAGRISKRFSPDVCARAIANGKATVSDDDYLYAINELDDDEKAELRESINFKQPQ